MPTEEKSMMEMEIERRAAQEMMGVLDSLQEIALQLRNIHTLLADFLRALRIGEINLS